MRAIRYPSYGPPAVARVVEVSTPTPGPGEVLVRVHETVVTRADMAFRSGEPKVARLFTGVRRPKHVPGGEAVGVVETVGSDVTRFGAGDRVIVSTGSTFGAHAEYVCVPADGLVVELLDDVDETAVAGLCDGGLTALQFLRDEAAIQAGESVLVNGASGAVGSYGVQVAAREGATVTGVCSTDNLSLVESLGADRVIDYTAEEFTAGGETYDVVFDAVGTSSYARCKPVLADGGRYLTTVLSLGILVRMATTRFGPRRAIFAATGLSQTRADLALLVDLVAAGDIESVVDRRYRMDEIVAAHRYVETGHKRGNVVLSMVGDD